MPAGPDIIRALVLQGGGALGAFELGVADVLYGEQAYAPDLIAGVSIGAITAVLLARPKGGDALAALDAFWRQVTVTAPWAVGPFKPYASVLGNPHFFMPRTDFWTLPWWTNFYSVTPLRDTLDALVDVEALADRNAFPRLLLTATDVEKGEIEEFYSGDGGLTLDHVLASGSLPPSFPTTWIGKRPYWDGGVFDNTPLGAVLKRMDRSAQRAAEREIIVVNLFPNAGQVPENMGEVGERALNLMFANKTQSDVGLLKRFNPIAGLLDIIRSDPRWAALAASEAFQAADQNYIQVPRIVTIARERPADGGAGGDFSPASIAARMQEGRKAAQDAFANRSDQPDFSKLGP